MAYAKIPGHCPRGHNLAEGSKHLYTDPKGKKQCHTCKLAQSRARSKKLPFLKSQLQFVKLVYDKYGEGERFNDSLRIVEEEGADSHAIKKLIIPVKLKHHHITLFAGDYDFLMCNTGNAAALIRDLVRETVAKMEGAHAEL